MGEGRAREQEGPGVRHLPFAGGSFRGLGLPAVRVCLKLGGESAPEAGNCSETRSPSPCRSLSCSRAAPRRCAVEAGRCQADLSVCTVLDADNRVLLG